MNTKITKSKTKKLTHSKIYRQFHRQINIQANKVKARFKNIPIEREDLVNQTIFELPNIHAAFDEKRNVAIEAYISLKAFYFMLNYARKFTTKNCQILNHYVDYEYVENTTWTPMIIEPEPSISICTEKLSSFEKTVFNEFFVRNNRTKYTAIKLNTCEKTISNAVSRIRKKLRQTIS